MIGEYNVQSSPVPTVEDAEPIGFEAAYRRTYWLVLAYARRRLGDTEAARDVVSETYRVAWVRHSEGRALDLAYLYATCRNLIGNEYRRQLRQAALVQRMQDNEPRPDAGSDHLREALLTLRATDREILYLAYWEELSATKIAAVLGCSEDAAWARTSRARRSLRGILQKKGITQ